jgi:hypothetical protein
VQPADAAEPLGLWFELAALPRKVRGGASSGRRFSLGGAKAKVEMLARAPSVETRDRWVEAVKAFFV